jgi:hypothetical protein
MWRWLAIGVAAATLSALSGVGAYQLVRPAMERLSAPSTVKWQEITWSFPRDGWPAGRAFRCASCGEGEAAIELYVRPKIGFCNCDTGVADDGEVDRVADLDLISERFAPVEAGKVVRLSDMAGRARLYNLKMSDGSQHTAIGIALSHRCDLLVAVAQGRANAEELQRAAVEFLQSEEVHHWMLTSLGGH